MNLSVASAGCLHYPVGIVTGADCPGTPRMSSRARERQRSPSVATLLKGLTLEPPIWRIWVQLWSAGSTEQIWVICSAASGRQACPRCRHRRCGPLPGTREPRWPVISRSHDRWVPRSTSTTRTRPGSSARTRTRTACCGTTSRRAPTLSTQSAGGRGRTQQPPQTHLNDQTPARLIAALLASESHLFYDIE
jgi:hypothetical protein